MKSEVTVLIPFYNTKKNYLAKAIDSVFNQSYKNWKIILINDASTIDCLSGLEEYLQDKRVTLVCNDNNLGQSKCLNIGLNLTDTPYVVQLDSDDWFDSNALQLLIDEMNQQDEKVGVVSGNIRIVFEDIDGNTVKSFDKQGACYSDKYFFMLENRSIWPRFYRTEALKNIGGWFTNDPHEGRYSEDLSILFKLIEKYRFHWIDKVLLNHRRHAHNQTNNMAVVAETVEWLVKDALKRWGDHFTPIFSNDSEGWKVISGLEKK